MSFVSPGTQYDFILGIVSILVIITACGFSFGILTSLLLKDKKKGYFFIGWIAIGVLGSLIVFFRNYTVLGIAALIIYVIFAVVTYFVFKQKKKN